MKHRKKSHPLSLDEASKYLEPHVGTLLDGFWKAHDWTEKWIDCDENARILVQPGTHASILFDAFAHFIRPMLIPAGVNWQLHGRTQMGKVEQMILLRFKKLTTDLRSMNIRTGAQARLYHQEEMANARKLTVVTLGYVLDDAAGVDGIYFVCPNGFESNHWTKQLYDRDGGQMAFFSATPNDPNPHQDFDAAVQVDHKSKIRKRKG